MSTPYEKSRLVIQAYLDYGKLEILSQSPTIQQLILVITPSLAENILSTYPKFHKRTLNLQQS